MRDRMEITAPRARGIMVHILKEGTGKPYCGANVTANTKIVSRDELMRMHESERVCAICMKREL